MDKFIKTCLDRIFAKHSILQWRTTRASSRLSTKDKAEKENENLTPRGFSRKKALFPVTENSDTYENVICDTPQSKTATSQMASGTKRRRKLGQKTVTDLDSYSTIESCSHPPGHQQTASLIQRQLRSRNK